MLKPKFPPETLREKIVIYSCVAILTVVFCICIIGCLKLATRLGIIEDSPKFNTWPAGRRESNVKEFGEELYLQKADEASYKIVSKNDFYDKKLEWAHYCDSYHEESSSYYVWYDSSSEEWLYWDYDISHNYGKYGWMKCGELGWVLEEDENTWTRVPEEFDRNEIWQITSE